MVFVLGGAWSLFSPHRNKNQTFVFFKKNLERKPWFASEYQIWMNVAHLHVIIGPRCVEIRPITRSPRKRNPTSRISPAAVRVCCCFRSVSFTQIRRGSRGGGGRRTASSRRSGRRPSCRGAWRAWGVGRLLGLRIPEPARSTGRRHPPRRCNVSRYSGRWRATYNCEIQKPESFQLSVLHPYFESNKRENSTAHWLCILKQYKVD